MVFFEYGQTEINYLKSADPELGEAIDRIGMITRQITPDIFTALIKSIISQQISSKASETIFNRLKDKIPALTAEDVFNLEVDEIQKCGISNRKAGYIKKISQEAAEKRLDLAKLNEMSDEEIIKTLSALPGIGVWTAQMMLIFSLSRPDVLSWGDLAIRRGMMNLYGLSELTKDEFLKYRHRYSPYASVASLYLWQLS